MKKIFNCRILASLRSMLIFCGLISMTLPFTACDDVDIVPAGDKPEVTVMLGLLGKGDNDYCSVVYKAFEKWENDSKVNMTVIIPQSIEEATRIYREWAVKTANGGKSLMVPASGGYADMVKNVNLNLKDNQQVLAFEMTLDEPIKGVYTFQIQHAGVAYLAGTLASLCEEACVIYGHKYDVLENACEHFNAGYKKYSNKDCKSVEISNDYDGFNMPEKAYEIMKEHPDEFILPLAGMSSAGVYQYLQDCDKNNVVNSIMAAGVDVDCNALSPRIAFSYIINIDNAIDAHLQCWYEGKPWPKKVWGLKSGITEIRINPDFKDLGGVTKADLLARYQENFEEAVSLDK